MIIRVALTIEDCLSIIVCVTDTVLVVVGKLVTVWTMGVPIKLVMVLTDVFGLGGRRTLIRWLF